MSDTDPNAGTQPPHEPWREPFRGPVGPGAWTPDQGWHAPSMGDTRPLTPVGGTPPPPIPGTDLDATVPLMPAVGAPAWPSGMGGPGDPAGPYGPPPYGPPPYGPSPYPTPPGGWETAPPPYATDAWLPQEGPQAGTAYGRPPAPPSGTRRRAAAGGSGGGGRTPAAVIVAAVMGVAAILAVAVWALLLRPMDGTASATPTPAATPFVTPPPTATPERSSDPDEPTPEPTRLRSPTFRGLRIRDAQSLADRSGVRIEVTYEVTDDVEPDVVIDQDPGPGSELLPGDVVTLTVAVPAPTVLVPDLRGYTEEDALAALLDAGLAIGTRSETHDDGTAAGRIIRTDPRDGIAVARETPVDYMVSLGPEPSARPTPAPTPLEAPVLVDLALEDAQALADDLGLVLDIRGLETLDVEAGRIVSQDPPPGSVLPPGSTVVVEVAVRPATVLVPDVRGWEEADALSTLLDEGLAVGSRSALHDDGVPAGRVIRTEPRGGIAVAPETLVDYTVSLGAAPTPSPSPAPRLVRVPDLRGMPFEDAESIALERELVLDVRTRETFGTEPGIVLEQDLDVDREVPVGSIVTVVVSARPSQVAVPVLRGLPEADAIAALEAVDLVPGERSERFHAVVAAGTVIRSDPAAGTIVALGAAVDYVVSLGAAPTPSPSPTPPPTPEPVDVPELRGRTLVDVQAFADSSGIELDVRERETEDVPQDTIMEQDPPAGSRVRRGDTVRITVARRPATVAVPALRGLSEADAVAALLDADLVPGERTERFHGSVPVGAVILSDPRAGERVARGTPVAYAVSRGPEPTPTPSPTPLSLSVPGFVGGPVGDARAWAEANGVTLDVTEQQVGDAPPGLVVDQDPREGGALRPGGTLRVVIAVPPSLVTVPELRGLSEADGVALLVEADLSPGRRIERFNDAVPAGHIVRTSPPAGERVTPSTAVDYVLSRGPEPTPSPTPEPTPSPTAEPVRVPLLRGLSEADGVALLVEADLSPGRRIERFNDAVPAGHIVRTDPPADTPVARGSTVDYVLSRGPEAVPVPEVQGWLLADAEAIAAAAGFTLEVTYEARSDVAPDTVLSQDPAPGTPADETMAIRVVVSRAPGGVMLPRLRGVAEADAIALLLDLGLVPGVRSERFSGAVPAGALLSTDPRGGAEVPLGTAVDYVVSRGPDAGGATPEPTPEVTPEATSGPIGGPTDDPAGDGIVARVEEVVASVPAIRELELLAGVPVRVMGAREFRQTLKSAMESATPPASIAAEATTLVRLGLIPPDTNLARTRLDLAANGVVAWYDRSSGTLDVIQREGALDAVVRFFAAGEAAEALIDQHVGLSDWRPDDLTQTDRATARAGLLGGDQALVMLDWAGANLSPDEQAVLPGLVATEAAVLDAAPLYLRRMATFPTEAGRAFVEALRGAAGWAAVNEAYGRPPASTEQILHPERYRDDRPVGIDLSDLAANAEGWSVTDERTLGEFAIGLWLDDGVDGSPNAWAADGWGGDRLVTLDGPDGSWAIIWQTAWDSDTDADEFSGMADQAMADLPGAHTVLRGVDVTGTGLPSPALVVVTSDAAVLDAFLAGTSPGG